MDILFAVSECVPFVKSGGLADVAGSLPQELAKHGNRVRVVLPKYKTIDTKYTAKMSKIAEFYVLVGWREQYCGIYSLELDEITYYFIDNEYYFKRDDLYGYVDDGERFSFFTRAVLDALQHIPRPDVIHCHDWHTGMVPFLYKTEYQNREGYNFINTVFTIHNLQFQGIYPPEVMRELLGISEYYFRPEHIEFYGNISFMKAGIVASDSITTVSPTYKEEIQTPYFGEKLDGLLRIRNNSLSGILNGIDYDFYNPEKDPFLKKNYSAESAEGKIDNKLAIQQTLGLPQNKDIPVMAMVTRLTKQKGLDLVKAVFQEIINQDIQIIILGTGDPEFSDFFQAMERYYPYKVKAVIGFNEELAHQIYAGADLFLMPSKFEPCGLGQLIAMRYGAVPIVRETGGLNDTVDSYNEWTGDGNGFSFKNFNAHDMLFTIERSLAFYRDKPSWSRIVKQAMEKDYSWSQSAYQYNLLYKELVSRSGSHVF
ncbi:glycogen synthase GlgA [Peribacillus deserti]|uniref:Glycogen synthase n=1 Tax=Peribacillus deserti TaxID=673318 RepID=A0A2N5M4M0_9BACI|nr:glycogen synthase GlgA [Peribacillus deserti]PLT29309.1 glycogen synthase GlgA [Peribacillus deserti]